MRPAMLPAIASQADRASACQRSDDGDTLRLEVRELASLVAQVRDGAHDQCPDRQCQTGEGRDHLRPDDGSRQWVAGLLGDEVGPGRDLGEAEQRLGERCPHLGLTGGVGDPQPHLGGTPEPGTAEATATTNGSSGTMTKRGSGSTTVGTRSAVPTTRIGMVPLPTCRSRVPSALASAARSD